MYVEASKAAVRVEGHSKSVTMLLVANSYEQDDLVGERLGDLMEVCPRP